VGPSDRRRVGRVRTAALASVALTAAALAGCGGSHSDSATTTATYHPLQPPATSTVPTPVPTFPRVGAAQRVPAGGTFPRVGAAQRVPAGGTTLSVTVERVLDPLDGSGAALLPHTRAVGVIAVIRNAGPGVYDSSSTGDFSVVPSSGTATPVFAPTGVCQTPLRDWDNEISPGGERSGCVAFALGTKATVADVRFSPHARAAGRATWAVGR
jgi:hypothetical protein